MFQQIAGVCLCHLEVNHEYVQSLRTLFFEQQHVKVFYQQRLLNRILVY
jgi:hypothetical protein